MTDSSTVPVDENSLPLRLIRGVLLLWLVGLVLGLTAYTGDPAGPIKYMFTGWAAGVCGVLLARHCWKGRWINAGGIPLLALVWIAVHMVAGWIHSPLEYLSRVDHVLWSDVFSGGAGDAITSLFVMHAPETKLWHILQSISSLAPWISGWVILCAITQAFREEKQQHRFFGVLLLVMMATNCYGFAQHFGWDPFPWSIKDTLEYKNLPSTFANPNFAGHALLLCIPVAIYLISIGKRWAWLPLATMLAHLYMTGMRSAALAVVGMVGLLVIVQVVKRFGMLPKRKALLTVIVLMLLAGLGAGAGVMAFSNGIIPDSKMDSSLLLRLNGYDNASRMITERPVLGIGPGRYGKTTPGHWTEFESLWYGLTGKHNGHVHNDLLETAVEAGLLGLLAFVLLLVIAVLIGLKGYYHYQSKPERNESRFALLLVLMIVGFVVDGLFGFPLRVPVSGALFFVVLGMVATLYGAKRTTLYVSRIVAVLALVMGMGGAVLSTQHFLAERAFQQATGAMEFLAENRTSRTALVTAQEAYADGRMLQPWDVRGWNGLAHLATMQGKHDVAHELTSQALALAPRDLKTLDAAVQGALMRVKKKTHYGESWLEHLLTHIAFQLRHTPQYLEDLGKAQIQGAVNTPSIHHPMDYNAVGALTRALHYSPANRSDRLFHRGLAQEMVYPKDWKGWQRIDFLQTVRVDPLHRMAWTFLDMHAEELPHEPAYAQLLLENMTIDTDDSTVSLASIHGPSLSRELIRAYDAPAVALEILGQSVVRHPDELALWGEAVALLDEDAVMVWVKERIGQLDAEGEASLPPAVVALAGLDVGNEYYSAYRAGIVGDLLLSADKDGRAWALLERAYRTLPEHDRWRTALNLSWCAKGLCDAEGAMEWALTAKELNPRNVEVQLNFAERLMDEQRYAEARFELSGLLRTVPGSSKHYGDIVALMEDVEQGQMEEVVTNE